jgi:hypothetical protein
MKLKASIAVFAVAAAFAGNVTATEVVDCRVSVGFTTAENKVNTANTAVPQIVANETGVWKAISVQQTIGYFLGKPATTTCMVPKNSKGRVVIEAVPVGTADVRFDLTQDQCSMYQSLGSADQKLANGRFEEAAGILSTLQGKLTTLSTPDKGGKIKLDPAGAKAISDSIDAAVWCIATIGQQ